jgi:hypothetical protein
MSTQRSPMACRKIRAVRWPKHRCGSGAARVGAEVDADQPNGSAQRSPVT